MTRYNIFENDRRCPLIVFCSTSVLQPFFYNPKSFESVSMMNYIYVSSRRRWQKKLLIKPSNGSLMIVIIELERKLNLNRFSSLRLSLH
jgi:hypothetical protein